MQRKAIFALPNILIDEDIYLEEKIILKKMTSADCNLLEEYNFTNLTTIEMNNFQTCDLYDKDIHEKCLDIVTKIKFTYFFKHISSGYGYPCFISEEAFDLFILLKKSEDTSFEHKIPITNGLTTFLMSLDEYYKYKNIFGKITSLKLQKETLNNFVFFNKFDNKKILIMDLYNKCRKISTLDDNFHRIIFARTSIEVLIKDACLSKKNYVDSFIDKSNNLIKESLKENQALFALYKELDFRYLKNKLDEYLNQLAKERHNIVHDGEKVINIPLEVYLVWFPLFFVVSYCNINEKIKFDLSLRILFFFKLLNINPNLWNKIHGRNFTKKTCLYAYDECVNVIPNLIRNNNLKYLETYIKGFNNCIEEKS